MAIYEFRNMLEVDTPFGRGHALFIEGVNHEYLYTVILHDTRALMTIPQDQLLVTRSYTHKWGMSKEDMKGILDALSEKTS